MSVTMSKKMMMKTKVTSPHYSKTNFINVFIFDNNDRKRYYAIKEYAEA